MTISLNPTENLFDPNINKQNFSSISLSVQLSLTNLSFCIIDNSQHKYLAIVNYVFPEKVSAYDLAEFLGKLFEYEILLKKDYKNIIISYESNQSTLVPSEIFDINKQDEYLRFLNVITEDKIVISNQIEDLKLYSVFSIPKSVYNVLNKNLSKFKLIHSSDSFIQCLYFNFSRLDNFNEKVFLNVENHEFELVVFRNNNLLLYNSFQFKTKEDFLYFLLFTLKQLNVDSTKIQLVLSGKITPNSAVFVMLTKYFSNVIFIENQSYYSFSEVLANIPPQQYFKLLNQIKCE